MLEFHKVRLEDRAWIHELLYAAGRQGCEYSFANLYFWLQDGVTRVGDFLCAEAHWGGSTSWYFPAGQGDPREVLELLRQHAEEKQLPFVLRGVTAEDRAYLEETFPGNFSFRESRNAWDYLYPVEQLATLAGKKLQAKRNHINRFVERFPHWYTRPLDGQTREDCQELARRWYEDREEIRGLSTERAALTEALARYDLLGMEGLVLYDGEKAVGFSLGNRITPEIYDVNFEKADPEVPGAYPLINREFSRRVAESYPQVRLLNREDDMGLEGLRKAKESYNPMMLEKMTAVWEG